MTALQNIIKEAKSIKKAYPNRFAKWTDYVKQASAIYASKHKGKSPVGKKKAVKKTAKKKLVKKKLTIKKISGSQDYYTRKKEGRVIPRKSTKKIVKKKSVKKPSEKDVLKSITHAVKVQKAHMSINGLKIYGLDKYKDVLKDIHTYNESIERIKKGMHQMTIPEKKRSKEVILSMNKIVKELKTHARELKKHI
jgi:hypothetical protein